MGGASERFEGWLFDCYPDGEGVRVWAVLPDGSHRQFLDPWLPRLFIEGSEEGLRGALGWLSRRPFPVQSRWTERAELYSGRSRRVLELRLPCAAYRKAAEGLRELGLTLYDADLHPAQAWHYERGHFPLAFCAFEAEDGRLRAWELKDDPWALDYPLPPLRVMGLSLAGGEVSGKVDPNHALRGSLQLEFEGRVSELEGGPEEQLESFERRLLEWDPDVLETEWGDSVLLGRLLAWARRLGRRLPLSRDPRRGVAGRGERSFHTYGRTVYQGGALYLFGRWHLDRRNSFMLGQTGRVGLYEVARLAKIPVQRAARCTIGTSLSSMQLDRAVRDGVLIPLEKEQVEDFRPATTMFVSDKGGLAYEPLVGWHEKVVEYDFVSMYPALMVRENVSPETVNCPCCPDNKVPEIGHHLCRRRRGLVPKVLAPILAKRASYKALAKAKGPGWEAAKARADAHKWILVCCFDGETQLLWREDGRVRAGAFRELVDPPMEGAMGLRPPKARLEVVGVDEAGRACWRRVKHVLRKPAPATLLKVRMSGGRELRVTSEHTCAVLKDGEIVRRRADELKVGDWVPILSRLPGAAEPVQELDLLKIMRGRLPEDEKRLWRVYGPGLGKLISMQWEALRNEAWKSRSVKTPYNWRDFDYLPLTFLDSVRLGDWKAHSLGRGKLSGGLIQRIPARLLLDGDIGFFLGFYVGDGSCSGNMVRLAVAADQPEIMRRLQRIVAQRFGLRSTCRKERKARMHVVQVNSVALRRILDVVFGLGPNAAEGKLRIPEAVLNGSAELRKGFLCGLLASDGFVVTRRESLGWVSMDHAFIKQLGLLLGMESHQYALYLANPSLARLDLAGAMDTRAFAKDAVVSEKHRRRLEKWKVKRARRMELPVRECGLLEIVRGAASGHWKASFGRASVISREAASSRWADARPHIGKGAEVLSERLSWLLGTEMVFKQIRSIEEVPASSGQVYCVELDREPRWIAVEGNALSGNCFGYLGYRNARFGKIESHECVTALGRETLLKAKEAAEAEGYRLLHALVDSLWLTGPLEGDRVELLRRRLEEEAGCAAGLEGVYRWIRFCPSRRDPLSGVPGRYFGAFRDGSLKVRGIAARRSDTPPYLKRLQGELLERLAGAGGLAACRALLPELRALAESYRERLRTGGVPAQDLALSFHLSKRPEDYAHDTLSALAAKALAASGVVLHPGESVRYVIADAKEKVKAWRVAPLALQDGPLELDAARYLELLDRAAREVLEGL